MDTTHHYRVTMFSTTVRSGKAIAEGISPSIDFSAPPEFQGEPGHWTPEHFFVAAVASCFVSTFSGMSSMSKFDFVALDLESEGVLEKGEDGWRFHEVVLHPTLKLARSEDKERGERLLEKAKKNCLVARSIACPVTMECAILVEELLPVG